LFVDLLHEPEERFFGLGDGGGTVVFQDRLDLARVVEQFRRDRGV
jgi:hypothetical protein